MIERNRFERDLKVISVVYLRWSLLSTTQCPFGRSVVVQVKVVCRLPPRAQTPGTFEFGRHCWPVVGASLSYG
jgi:hypothetical protein